MATKAELSILDIIYGALELHKGQKIEGGKIKSVSIDGDGKSGEVIVDFEDDDAASDKVAQERSIVISTGAFRDITGEED